MHGCTAPEAKIKCNDMIGEEDKLVNWGSFVSSTTGGWVARCRIKFNYYIWVF